MRERSKFYITILTISVLLFTGCGVKPGNQAEAGADSTNSTNSTNNTVEVLETGSSSSSQVVVDTEFTARDLEVGYEESTATKITLNGSSMEVSGDGAAAEGGVLTISQEGTYVLSGTLNDGQILVDAGDSDKIHIIFNGITISHSQNAPVYIKNADKVFITLNEGTKNTLTDGAEYVQTDDNNVDGVIFSKADLTINGDGTLNITGNYKHGIVSKDDLVITGGTFNITAAKDALNGKDCVKIKEGTLNLSAEEGNGIQSKNGDNATKGYVYIAGGDITVLKSQEGIEGTVILIEDGTINITAADDGLNAASGSSETEEDGTAGTNKPENQTANAPATSGVRRTRNAANETTDTAENTADTTDANTAPANGNFRGGFGGGDFGGGRGGDFGEDTNCYISITGGLITINANADGIDSNGSLYISGGSVYISGPTNNGNGALDYNGKAEITGGTVIAAGSSGMAQGFSDTSTQYSLLYYFTSVIEGGTEIKLTDEDGNVVAAYLPDKEYQSVVISTPELAKDNTYTITCGDQTADITLTSVVTSNGQQGRGGPGGNGGPGGGSRG